MALVVLQVTLPLLGFVTLDRIVRGEYDKLLDAAEVIISKLTAIQ